MLVTFAPLLLALHLPCSPSLHALPCHGLPSRRLPRQLHLIQPVPAKEALRPLPLWVTTVNSALTTSASSTLLAFVLADLGAASCILGALIAFRIQVNADWAIALALAKALRGPRLAVDASLAAVLARYFPSLKAVRLSRLLDELSSSWAEVKSAFDEGRGNATLSSADETGQPAALPRRRERRGAGGLTAARSMVDEYGLAYLAAKNIIGPLCTLLALAALRSGGPAKAATAWLMRKFGVASGAVGAFAGQVALAATLSHLLFPGVVLAAARLAPAIARRRGAGVVSRVSKNPL